MFGTPLHQQHNGFQRNIKYLINKLQHIEQFASIFEQFYENIFVKQQIDKYEEIIQHTISKIRQIDIVEITNTKYQLIKYFQMIKTKQQLVMIIKPLIEQCDALNIDKTIQYDNIVKHSKNVELLRMYKNIH